MASVQKPESTVPRVMTLQEIAAEVSLEKVKQLAAERNLSYVIQDNDTMRAQKLPEYNQSKRFGAEGRLWMTFSIQQKKNNATVLVSFFYSKDGYILGRAIIVENDNNP